MVCSPGVNGPEWPSYYQPMLPGRVAWISVQARQGVPNRSFRVNCSTIISTIATGGAAVYQSSQVHGGVGSKCHRVHFPHVQEASQKAQAPSQEEDENRVTPVSVFALRFILRLLSKCMDPERANSRRAQDDAFPNISIPSSAIRGQHWRVIRGQRSVSSSGSKSGGWLRTRKACAASSTRTHRRTPPMALE
jgi:hypothetical protein